MTEKRIKQIIESNLENLPISFNEIVFKPVIKSNNKSKVVFSKNLNDSFYEIFKFYKPISRIE